MKKVRQRVSARRRLKQTIELRRTQGPAAALEVVNTDRGKFEMDAIRAQLAAMALIEAELRDKRLSQMNDAYGTALAQRHPVGPPRWGNGPAPGGYFSRRIRSRPSD
jgi:CHASE3 domain sensor protein